MERFISMLASNDAHFLPIRWMLMEIFCWQHWTFTMKWIRSRAVVVPPGIHQYPLTTQESSTGNRACLWKGMGDTWGTEASHTRRPIYGGGLHSSKLKSLIDLFPCSFEFLAEFSSLNSVPPSQNKHFKHQLPSCCHFPLCLKPTFSQHFP